MVILSFKKTLQGNFKKAEKTRIYLKIFFYNLDKNPTKDFGKTLIGNENSFNCRLWLWKYFKY